MKKLDHTIIIGMLMAVILVLFLQIVPVMAVQNFPPPEFESDYQMPEFALPDISFRLAPWADVAMLFGSLSLASWLSIKKRSRRGLFITMLGSMLYFGFIRKGCVCPIGSIQNVAYAIFDQNYSIEWPVLAFFGLPIIFALFFGRVFCSAVCPLGAIQELAILKPMKVPFWLENILQLGVWFYLAVAILLATTGMAFIICRFDPFISIYRFTASTDMLILTGAFLLLSMFIGRPYCRFGCPYGVILRQAARLSRWKVSILPPGAKCIQCRLCLPHCPFDAINPPAAGLKKDYYTPEIRKIAIYLLITAFMVVLGGYTGYTLGGHLAQGDLAVLRAAVINDQPTPGISQADRQAIAASIRSAGLEEQEINATAEALIRRFKISSGLILAGLALVISVKLVKTTIYRTSSDYMPDAGNCLSCGRCFASCPTESLTGESPA